MTEVSLSLYFVVFTFTFFCGFHFHFDYTSFTVPFFCEFHILLWVSLSLSCVGLIIANIFWKVQFWNENLMTGVSLSLFLWVSLSLSFVGLKISQIFWKEKFWKDNLMTGVSGNLWCSLQVPPTFQTFTAASGSKYLHYWISIWPPKENYQFCAKNVDILAFCSR